MGKTRRKYADSYKAQFVELVINSGRPVAEIHHAPGPRSTKPNRQYSKHRSVLQPQVATHQNRGSRPGEFERLA